MIRDFSRTFNGKGTADLNDDSTYAITISPLITSRLSCPQEIMQ